MRVRGADFSSYQSIAQLELAVKQGIGFAFVKLTQGVDYVNPLASEQLHELQIRGVMVGVYHFLTADVDGAAQWDHFEKTLAGRPCAVAVDHESNHGVMPPNHVARAFIKRGQQRGFKVGRYASGSVFKVTSSLGEDWRWVAWWASTPPPFKWDVWQWSNGGGKQDWNYFHGNHAQLARWMTRMSPRRPKPVRWWLHDDVTTLARGPFRLPRLGAAVVAYLARHPKSARLRLVRK